MPDYKITLSDGRTFKVTANAPPSEADVMAKLGLSEKKPTLDSSLSMGFGGGKYNAGTSPQSESEVNTKESLLGRTVRALRGENPGMNVIANLIPLAMTSSLNARPNPEGNFTAGDVVGRMGNAVKTAVKEAPPGIKGMASVPFRALGRLNDAMPLKSAAAVEEFVGPKKPPVKSGLTILKNAPDMWDRAKAAGQQGDSAPGFPQGKANPNEFSGGYHPPEPGASEHGFPTHVDRTTGPGGYTPPEPGASEPGFPQGRGNPNEHSGGYQPPEPGASVGDYPQGSSGGNGGYQEPEPGASDAGWPRYEDKTGGADLGGYTEPTTDPDAMGQAHINQVTLEAIQQMLKDSRPQSVSLPDDAPIIEGATRQSGKFKRSDSLGQAGGYSAKGAMSPQDVEGMGKAAQDIQRGQSKIDPSGNLPDNVSETRYQELKDGFGGTGPDTLQNIEGTPGSQSGDVTSGAPLPSESAPTLAAGPSTAQEALEKAATRLSGLPKKNLTPQQWQERIKIRGFDDTAEEAGLSKEELGRLSGVDPKAKRPKPVEAQQRIDEFNMKKSMGNDRDPF